MRDFLNPATAAYLGAGVSYRPKWREDLLAGAPSVGCLEVIVEHYLDAPREKLEELALLQERYPLLPHGIGLSFGTDAPPDEERLRKTALLVERLRPPWFTEHLAFTEAHGHSIGHLAPLPFNREAAGAVCRNVRRWREAVALPLLLENVTYDVLLPGEWSEAEFLTEVTSRAECGLLLDLHNVHTNARNHGFDPLEFIGALPLERVYQVHLGGGHDEPDGYRIDSHAAPAPPEVWDLLRYVAARAPLRAAIVEWDVNLPPFAEILAQVESARGIMES